MYTIKIPSIPFRPSAVPISSKTRCTGDACGHCYLRAGNETGFCDMCWRREAKRRRELQDLAESEKHTEKWRKYRDRQKSKLSEKPVEKS